MNACNSEDVCVCLGHMSGFYEWACLLVLEVNDSLHEKAFKINIGCTSYQATSPTLTIDRT